MNPSTDPLILTLDATSDPALATEAFHLPAPLGDDEATSALADVEDDGTAQHTADAPTPTATEPQAEALGDVAATDADPSTEALPTAADVALDARATVIMVPPLVDPVADGDVIRMLQPIATPSPRAVEQDWRATWPTNELRLVARIDPRYTQAQAIDGINRVRMNATLDQDSVPELIPLHILPAAVGLSPITAQAARDRFAKRRSQPMLVEMVGLVHRLHDRDGRYEPPRVAHVTALEIRSLEQRPKDTPHLAVWRGRGTVRQIGFTYFGNVRHQRVTLLVAHQTTRPGLRGISQSYMDVDVLVAPHHPHAGRLEQGAQVLVEAEVRSQTMRLADDDPHLAGLDEEARERLQTVHDAILVVTMVERVRPTVNRPAHRASTESKNAKRSQATQSNRPARRETTGSNRPDRSQRPGNHQPHRSQRT